MIQFYRSLNIGKNTTAFSYYVAKQKGLRENPYVPLQWALENIRVCGQGQGKFDLAPKNLGYFPFLQH